MTQASSYSDKSQRSEILNGKGDERNAVLHCTACGAHVVNPTAEDYQAHGEECLGTAGQASSGTQSVPRYVVCECGWHALDCGTAFQAVNHGQDARATDEPPLGYAGRCPECLGVTRYANSNEFEDISIMLTRLEWRTLVERVRRNQQDCGELQLGRLAWKVIAAIEAKL